MSFEKVFDQYIKAIAKQLKRRNRRDVGNSFTSNEEKAIAYYGRAAQQLKALIEAPAPAWSGLVFEKTIRL
jgi:hypothetical protein